MFRSHLKRVASLGASMALVFTLAPAVAGGDGTPLPVGGPYCYGHIEPVTDPDVPSVMTPVGCFATFAEMTIHATDGVVVPPIDATFETFSVTPEMVEGTSSGVPIGTDFEDPEYDENLFGPSYTWYGNGSGCYGYSYWTETMPVVGGFDWNDQVSSAFGQNGCWDYIHFDYAYRGGATIDCGFQPDCAHMGAMNDRTSSEQWSQ